MSIYQTWKMCHKVMGVGGLAWGPGGYARTDRPRVEDVVLHVRVYCEAGDPRSTCWGSQAFKLDMMQTSLCKQFVLSV